MNMLKPVPTLAVTAVVLYFVSMSAAQMIDNTQAPNTAKAGINKSLLDEIGAGRGDVMTPGSSIYIISRDPYRSIRRGRQLFQRKFTHVQGQGPTKKTASATSTPTSPLARVSPIAVPYAMGVPAVREVWEE